MTFSPIQPSPLFGVLLSLNMQISFCKILIYDNASVHNSKDTHIIEYVDNLKSDGLENQEGEVEVGSRLT